MAISFERVPVCEISSPDNKDVVQIYKNYWWVVIDGNVLLYRGSPQCNRHKEITDKMIKRHQSSEAVQIPYAYVPYAYVPWDD